jgi:hypothetical protein
MSNFIGYLYSEGVKATDFAMMQGGRGYQLAQISEKFANLKLRPAMKQNRNN